MTQNTVASYNELIDIMESMIENASDEESSLLEESVERIQQAKRKVLNEKDEVSKMLYESGEMSSDEYNEYHKYLKDELLAVESELTPYAKEIGIATSLALSESENIALESAKYHNIMEKEDGDYLESEEMKFIKSRAHKYGMICESEELLPYEEDVNSNVMTSGIREFLENASKVWKNYKISSEKAASSYIKSAIEEYGNTSCIVEAVDLAVENNEIPNFVAEPFRKMIALQELRNS